MSTVLTMVVHLSAKGGRAIADVEVEGEFDGGQLVAISTDQTGWMTEGYCAGTNDLLAKVLWLAAVRWADEHYQLIAEAEYEQREAAREIALERNRELAA